MLVAPLLALGMQSLVFSLVTPSCAHQGGIGMHALSGATLLLAALLTALAGQGWRAAALLCRRAGADPADHAPERDLFIGRVATLVGVFSTLTIAALWIPLWLLPPCS